MLSIKALKSFIYKLKKTKRFKTIVLTIIEVDYKMLDSKNYLTIYRLKIFNICNC